MKFKEGKIIDIIYISRGKTLEPVIIRYPKKSDVKSVWKFYNKVIRETENLNRVSVVSLKDEKKWISESISKMKKDNIVLLFAESGGKIVGSASIERRFEERKKHVGSFGICILQEFTGLGLGAKMMTALEKNIINAIRLLVLDVYGKNKIAQALYKKMGFKTLGAIPYSVKTKRGFQSDIYMYKVLKK